MVKKVLEDQLSQIQQERDAAKEQKKKEAAELRESIRQHEEEEYQKWQQHKEQQAKTKHMYSQQVTQPEVPQANICTGFMSPSNQAHVHTMALKESKSKID